MNKRTLKIFNDTGIGNDTEVRLGEVTLPGVIEVTLHLSQDAFNSARLVLEAPSVGVAVDEEEIEVALSEDTQAYYRALGPALTRKISVELFKLAEKL